jgi:CubicO group peptidase (beta-lactamase class C family)
VLTSARTFSAGEGFAFLLQERRRAEVIGERTAGAANPGAPHRVQASFEVTVPTSRVRSAVSGRNWEGTGVTPDVPVAESEALTVALARAREHLSASTQRGRIGLIDGRLSELEANGLTGAILIRRAGETILHKAYGQRDRQTGERLTLEHGFDIGSIVKPITAAAILKLQESGALTLGDTLVQHFPQIPADKRRITIRQVLTHTAGFPDSFGGDYDIVTRELLLNRLFRAPLIARPGDEENYSNAGYSLLAALIEARSGQPYERYVRDVLLAPAGVMNIGYRLAGWRSANLVVTYGPGGVRRGSALDQPWAADGPSWNLRGNGGMLATTQSLSRWFEALFKGNVLANDGLKQFNEMFVRPSRLTGTPSFGFAGGDDVFNAFQASYLTEDGHVTFFTSDARFKAEEIWPELSDLIVGAISSAEGVP